MAVGRGGGGGGLGEIVVVEDMGTIVVLAGDIEVVAKHREVV